MILVIDTFGGLCNQMMDIKSIVSFADKYNFNFSFRFANFRNYDLLSWYNVNFNELFDDSFLIDNINYIKFNEISKKINNKNSFNFESRCVTKLFNKTNNNVLSNQIKEINKDFIILKQFWCLFDWSDNVKNINILPNKKIKDIYDKYSFLTFQNNKYNFIHFRFEDDFKNYFNLSDNDLDLELISNKIKFKNDYPTYLATYYNLLSIKNKEICKKNNFINKDEFINTEYKSINYEERAFIDYLIGLNADEVYGHNKSSFSTTLNTIKKTNNYYN
jgi:hypothetical protein